MKSPSKSSSRLPRLSLAAALALSVTVAHAPACGPFFPNSYLSASTANILAAPEGFFAAELARIGLTPPPEKAVNTVSRRGPSAQADIADVRRALSFALSTSARANEIGDAYEAARNRLEEWVSQETQRTANVREMRGWLDPAEFTRRMAALPGPEPFPTIALPDGLPEEFAKYFAGAVAWHQGKFTDARSAWEAVLGLSEAQRRNRSVWAAFMLGRLAAEQAAGADAEKSAAEAARFCQQARAFAAAGCPDPLGLAAASYGWEAKAALTTKNFPSAIKLYLAQRATGDLTATESLRRTAQQASESDDALLAALARDTTARSVVTAFFTSLAGPESHVWREAPGLNFPKALARWATALQRAGLGNVPDADRLAWVAYEAGDFAQTKQWAALAPADAWAAEWVRAKLALRDGNLAEGEARLRGALAALPQDGARIKASDYREDMMFVGHSDGSGTFSTAEENRMRLQGEIGRVCLARNEFTDALTAWIEGGDFEETSYIAERVMSLDELRAYVDAHCPEDLAVPPSGNFERSWPNYVRRDLRSLLARRLARANKFEEAAPYFPEYTRKIYTAYLADVRLGYDNAKPAAERAEAFWRAAQTARNKGLELFGTEQAPDWRIWDGNYDLESVAVTRVKVAQPEVGGVLATTSTELERLKENPVPEKRFSYRYRAADLAWWAAALLPNDSDETARILDTAGRWLIGRDDKAAERFYQALVIRCGNTALGKAAAEKHWFPSKPAASASPAITPAPVAGGATGPSILIETK
jgi:hypothetical protein